MNILKVIKVENWDILLVQKLKVVTEKWRKFILFDKIFKLSGHLQNLKVQTHLI